MNPFPDWMLLPPSGIDTADYEALSDEVCKYIEIVDGGIVVRPEPTRRHQTVVRRVADELERSGGPEIAVATSVDLRLRDVPLLNRRPDIVVYDSALPDEAVLRPQHCLLVVEVMSPGSVTADQTDNPPSTPLRVSNTSGVSNANTKTTGGWPHSATGWTPPHGSTPRPGWTPASWRCPTPSTSGSTSNRCCDR
ncbi:Uma2 family endonuclease [Saccharopolyspora sp. NPDC050642]|uniref:Uma2 family endonuclease n=1 Tax=Saccharopolyspora sp. NPDC050642 TaxID=3157099 RepID=UPI0033FE24D6